MNPILAQIRSLTNLPETVSDTIAWWKFILPFVLVALAISWVVNLFKRKKY
jgi:hypothetical protein